MKRVIRKLRIRADTVRVLASSELRVAAGGVQQLASGPLTCTDETYPRCYPP